MVKTILLVQKNLRSKKILEKKNVGSKNFCVSNKFWTPKNVGSNKIFCPPQNFLIKKNLGPKNSSQKNFWSKKILFPQKIFGSKNVRTEKICPIIKYNKNKGPKKIGSKNFRQNLVSNSWNIPYMEKCHLESSHLLKIGPETYL